MFTNLGNSGCGLTGACSAISDKIITIKNTFVDGWIYNTVTKDELRQFLGAGNDKVEAIEASLAKLLPSIVARGLLGIIATRTTNIY